MTDVTARDITPPGMHARTPPPRCASHLNFSWSFPPRRLLPRPLPRRSSTPTPPPSSAAPLPGGWPLLFVQSLVPGGWPLLFVQSRVPVGWPLLFVQSRVPVGWPLLFVQSRVPVGWPLLILQVTACMPLGGPQAPFCCVPPWVRAYVSPLTTIKIQCPLTPPLCSVFPDGMSVVTQIHKKVKLQVRSS